MEELQKCKEYDLAITEPVHENIQQALRHAFLLTDKHICEHVEDFGRAGSTAAVAFIRKNENGEKWLYTANVGDARVVLWYA